MLEGMPEGSAVYSRSVHFSEYIPLFQSITEYLLILSHSSSFSQFLHS